MKKLLLIALTVISGLGLSAQQDTSHIAKKKSKFVLGQEGMYLRDSTWHIGGYIGFNASQTALYQWSGGGTNSFAMLFAANFYAKYKKKKVSWDTNLDLKYGMVANGQIKTAGLAERNFQKNIDIIQLSTNLGYDITDHLYFSGKLGFLSQFSRSYDYSQTDTAKGAFQRYTVSKFAAPAIVTLGPGFTWKPKDYFTMFFTPIEGKVTFVAGPAKDTAKSTLGSDYYTGVDPTRFGLTAGTSYQACLGAEIDILFQKDIIKNINWKSHLNVFVTYTTNSYNTVMPLYDAAADSMETKTISKSTEHIPVVTWDNDIVFKVNKFLNAMLSTRFIYQYNALTPVAASNGLTGVDKNGNAILTYNKLQIFEQFSLGLVFKF